MAVSQSPIICVTCKRPFPDDLKAEDSPRYFAQYELLPKSDSDHAFATEARNITEFISAVGEAMRYSDKEIEHETYNALFDLITELSNETMRRLTLSLDATSEIWTRDHGREALARKAGV